eukprot:178960_1
MAMSSAATGMGVKRLSSETDGHNVGNTGQGRAPIYRGNRKLTIKPFKAQPKVPEGFEDEMWLNLKAAIIAVNSQQPISTSREELYRAVEDLCANKCGAKLYTRLQEECDGHIAVLVKSLVGLEYDTEAYLKRVDETWQRFCENQLSIRNIFLCLDRQYVLQNPALPSLWDMGLYLLRKHLDSVSEVQGRMISGLLCMIERERKGETTDRGIIRSLVRLLQSVGLYDSPFEGRLIEETENFYGAEGVRYMEQADIPQFLVHVEERLAEEVNRTNALLARSTRKALMSAVESNLLGPHATAILDRGFDALMDANRMNDLQRIYSLFSCIGCLSMLKDKFVAYVRDHGLAIVMDKENDKEMIELLLSFKAKLSEILNVAFMKNEQYTWAHKDIWETFINVRSRRTAERLAKYIDVKLRRHKGISEDEMETVLDQIMVLFKHLSSKDTFDAFYKRELGKRLLLGRSASFDLEMSMIAKLKAECGPSFTNKLEGMFMDIELTRSLTKDYQEHLDEHKSDDSHFRVSASRNVDVSVQVLTTGYWPAYVPVESHLPAIMSDHTECFNSFYCEKYHGRRLSWQAELGHCVLKVNFPKGRKELAVSQLQATVLLMCFNSADVATVEEICAATGIRPDLKLKLTLQSLACGKVHVLSKHPKGRDVNDGDTFTFCKDFTSKLFRITINAIQLKETVEENQTTHEAVFRDQQCQIDAVIVRIMKARKKLSHQLLMSEVMNQLKFPATAPDLKRRIESLLERIYIERNADGTGYIYVA